MPIYIIESLDILNGPVNLPVVPGLGVQLPSNAIQLETALPTAKSGYAWVLIGGAPQELEDLRGLYYSTADGRAVQVDSLGPLPENVTPEPRPSEFHEWGGGTWELNAAAQSAAAAEQAKQQRDTALREAGTRIAPLQDAVDLGVATDAEAEQLRLWKVYRVQLSRIEQQTGFPLAIEWPAPPAA